jgi:hypothetical protein
VIIPVRHPSIRTLGEPAFGGPRCSLESVQSGAAISETVSRTRGPLAVARTGRFRMLVQLKPYVPRPGRCYLGRGLESLRVIRSRPVMPVPLARSCRVC